MLDNLGNGLNTWITAYFLCSLLTTCRFLASFLMPLTISDLMIYVFVETCPLSIRFAWCKWCVLGGTGQLGRQTELGPPINVANLGQFHSSSVAHFFHKIKLNVNLF